MEGHILAHASLSVPYEVYMSFPPKAVGQQCNYCEQLYYQRDTFLVTQLSMLEKDPQPATEPHLINITAVSTALISKAVLCECTCLKRTLWATENVTSD